MTDMLRTPTIARPTLACGEASTRQRDSSAKLKNSKVRHSVAGSTFWMERISFRTAWWRPILLVEQYERTASHILED